MANDTRITRSQATRFLTRSSHHCICLLSVSGLPCSLMPLTTRPLWRPSHFPSLKPSISVRPAAQATALIAFSKSSPPLSKAFCFSWPADTGLFVPMTARHATTTSRRARSDRIVSAGTFHSIDGISTPKPHQRGADQPRPFAERSQRRTRIRTAGDEIGALAIIVLCSLHHREFMLNPPSIGM
jgi:hypothetical protein